MMEKIIAIALKIAFYLVLFLFLFFIAKFNIEIRWEKDESGRKVRFRWWLSYKEMKNSVKREFQSFFCRKKRKSVTRKKDKQNKDIH